MIWMEYGVLLRVVDVMNHTHLSCLISIQGREPYNQQEEKPQKTSKQQQQQNNISL